ncbi:MAG TPA: hypothetical protein PLI95_03485 [Polyangiaceae bacterium]|nr:hypothetical protein [Polyangiaceae bacterium]
MRGLFTLETGSFRLVGTHHVPSWSARTWGVGVVLFNAGHLPRDGHAMINVRAAERLAASGFHAFRVDLPGLGDSPGELPVHTEELFRLVHQGWHLAPAQAAIRELQRLHGIRSFVVGGLCGSAGTALLLAAADPTLVAGVVAMELELFHAFRDVPLSPREAVFSRAAWLRLLTGHGRRSWRVPRAAESLLPLFGSALLPAHTDRKLVHALVELDRRRTPVLVVMAGGKRREIFYDQVCRAVLGATARPWRAHVSVAGTNHIFTTGGGQRIALDAIERWALRLAEESHGTAPAAGHRSRP